MVKLDQVKSEELERRLQAALAQGALPGEREGFEEADAEQDAHFMAKALERRSPGIPSIIIGRLPAATKGATRVLRIALVNDDMPFLVDSVANCLAAQGVVIRRLMHPVLGVERESDGKLVRVLPKDSPGARSTGMTCSEGADGDRPAPGRAQGE